jgi:hypothetical protein
MTSTDRALSALLKAVNQLRTSNDVPDWATPLEMDALIHHMETFVECCRDTSGPSPNAVQELINVFNPFLTHIGRRYPDLQDGTRNLSIPDELGAHDNYDLKRFWAGDGKQIINLLIGSIERWKKISEQMKHTNGDMDARARQSE